MELKEFITAALVDIVQSVHEAREKLKEDSDCVCPPSGIAYLEHTKMVRDSNGRYLQEVYFDIAVTTENTGTNGGKIGIKVCALEANIGKSTDITNTSTSRIKFQVPIALKAKKLSN